MATSQAPPPPGNFGNVSIETYLKLFEQYTSRIQWVLLTSLVLGGILAARVYVWHFGYEDALREKVRAQLVQEWKQAAGPRCEDADLIATTVRMASSTEPPASTDQSAALRFQAESAAWLHVLEPGKRSKIQKLAAELENSRGTPPLDRLPVLGVNVSEYDLVPISGIFLIILYGWLLGLAEHLRVLAADLAKRLTKTDLLRNAQSEDYLVITRSLPAQLVLFWPSSRRNAYLQSLLIYFAVLCLGFALVSDAVDIMVSRHAPLINDPSVLAQIRELDASDERNSYVIGLCIKEAASLLCCVICAILAWAVSRRIREVVGMVAVLRWTSCFRKAIEEISTAAHRSFYGRGGEGDENKTKPPKLTGSELGKNDIAFAPLPGQENERWPLRLVLCFELASKEHSVECSVDADFSDGIPPLVANDVAVVKYFRGHLEPQPQSGPLAAAINAVFSRVNDWPPWE